MDEGSCGFESMVGMVSAILPILGILVGAKLILILRKITNIKSV